MELILGEVLEESSGEPHLLTHSTEVLLSQGSDLTPHVDPVRPVIVEQAVPPLQSSGQALSPQNHIRAHCAPLTRVAPPPDLHAKGCPAKIVLSGEQTMRCVPKKTFPSRQLSKESLNRNPE